MVLSYFSTKLGVNSFSYISEFSEIPPIVYGQFMLFVQRLKKVSSLYLLRTAKKQKIHAGAYRVLMLRYGS